MNRSRITGNLTSHGILYSDIANDRVGIGSTIPGNKLSLPDSAKIGLGNAEDLTVVHDGNNSTISNSTGGLYLQSDTSINIDSKTGSHQYIHCTKGAEVSLWHNNSKKLETTSTGVQVGNYSGNPTITLAASQNGPSRLNFLDNNSTEGIVLRAEGASAGGQLVFCNKWNTETDRAVFDAGTNPNFTLYDSVKLQLGTDADIALYHNGSDAFIDNDTGDLRINTASGTIEINKATNEYMARFITDGAVELYHNNLKKLETISTGVKVQHTGNAELQLWAGEAANAELHLYADENDDDIDHWKISANGADSKLNIQNHDGSNWEKAISATPNGTVELYHNAIKRLATESNGIYVYGTNHHFVGQNTSGNSNCYLELRSTGTAVYQGLILKNSDASANCSITSHGGSTIYYSATQHVWSCNGMSPHERIELSTTGFNPRADGLVTLGTTSKRWGNVHADAATINGTCTATTFSGSGASLTTLNADNISSGTLASARIEDNAVTYAKMGNISANRLMGRITSGDGDPETLTAANVRTIINVEDGATADQTASEILTLIKTVDGTGSGLDADTLDGVSSGSFLRSDANDAMSSLLALTSGSQYPLNIQGANDGKIVLQGSSNPYITFRESSTDKGYLQWHSDGYLKIKNHEDASSIRIKDAIDFSTDDSTWHTVWHAGNDGAGSGLDADTVDGFATSTGGGASKILVSGTNNYLYLDSWMRVSSGAGIFAVGGSHFFNGGASTWKSWINQSTDSGGCGIGMRTSQGTDRGWTYANSSHVGFLNAGGSWILRAPIGDQNAPQTGGGYALWHTNNDGSGSGLDADTVDGIQASSFLRSDASDSASGTINFTNSYNAFGNGTGSVSNDGNWNARLNVAGTTHARFDVKSVSDGIITTLYSHTGHNSGKVGTRSNHNLDFLCNSNVRGTLTTGGQLSTTVQGILWGASNDGSGSGLDSDLLDGLHAGSFLRSDANDSYSSGTLTIHGLQFRDGGRTNNLKYQGGTGTDVGLSMYNSNNAWVCQLYGTSSGHYGFLDANWASWDIRKVPSGAFEVDEGSGLARVWCATNDGSGSGLDADTLDGTQLDSIVRHNHNSNYILRFGSGTNTGHTNSSYAYAIFQESGAWSSGGGTDGYPDLRINYHTGIVLAAHQNYGGVRVHRDYNDTTELFSVGKSDNHVRVNYSLQVNETIGIGVFPGTSGNPFNNLSKKLALGDNDTGLGWHSDGIFGFYGNGQLRGGVTTDGLAIYGEENGQAALTFEADEGDDNADKWQLVAKTNGELMFQGKAPGDWRNAGYMYYNSSLGHMIYRGPAGGVRYDDNINSPSWTNYGGDGMAHRSNGQAYHTADDHFRIRKNGGSENRRFDLRTDTGHGEAQNNWNANQFDFAEMFEWSDGNPSGEDRIGHTVAIDGLTGKIKIAADGDTVIGVVSGTAGFIANNAGMNWHGAYLRDEWGRFELELVKDADGNQLYGDPDNGNVQPKVNLKPNPDWNESIPYHRREDRKEWDAIGIMGQCYVRKTAVIPSNWIKLKEIDSVKDFYLIR